MPIYTLHEDRKGGDLFLFTHLTVEEHLECSHLEVSVFIYLFNAHLQVRSCFRL